MTSQESKIEDLSELLWIIIPQVIISIADEEWAMNMSYFVTLPRD